MLLQVRDVFEEVQLMVERHVVKKNEVLVNLAHVADVRNNGQAEFRHSVLCLPPITQSPVPVTE
jgi:hypothetical protein